MRLEPEATDLLIESLRMIGKIGLAARRFDDFLGQSLWRSENPDVDPYIFGKGAAVPVIDYGGFD